MTAHPRDKHLVDSPRAVQTRDPLRFFTICARNFLPAARILHDSVMAVHPDAVFTVYLCDRDMGYDPNAVGMDIQTLESLGIPKLERMIRTYNITELCTAIKPYCFLREFSLSGAGRRDGTHRLPGHVIYLDPDIEVFSPLEEVVDALDDGAQAVLTPHVLKPAERVESHDQQYLQLGIYNLGFLGLRKTPEVHNVLCWWGRRMEEQCVIDLPNGIFVDQKWMDLLPSFLDEVKILRHPGYNIAYWNLHERRIATDAETPECNGEPLRFVHYSGLILDETEQITRHSKLFYLSSSFGYGPLVESYRARLNAPENRQLRQLPYAFFWNGAGDTNLHTPGNDAASAWRRPGIFLFARQAFTMEQYLGFLETEAREIEMRRATETALTPKTAAADGFEFSGFCTVCNAHRTMVTSLLYSCQTDGHGAPIPNWREHVACRSCRLQNRVRAAFHLFLQEFDPAPDSRIYITEQKTALYDLLASRFSHLTGSEYFGSRVPKGALHDGVRNENFETLSFQSESFDFLLSFDVLEHVPHPDRAFAEAFRVLKPGGRLIFSVPSHLDRYPSTVRAELSSDGQIVHHLPPEYHGNPVDPEGGSLCFRHFGWDVMDMLREAGFPRPFLYHYWSREFGYLGAGQVLFIAEKPQ